MSSDSLTVASCQFSVEADIDHNLRSILSLMDQASARGARVMHFSESALSGYAGVEFPTFEKYRWEQLQEATRVICDAAHQHQAWVLLGSAHRLSGSNRPHNCVYVIGPEGKIVDRYDKRFCTGRDTCDPAFDLYHYSPGNRCTVFDVDGFRCAVLICYDYRFPELYRELKQQGVEVLFQSFHNARRDREMHETRNIWKEIVPATMMCHAATNFLWISATNSTARYSSWPSFFVRPDGHITGRLPEHEPGVLISQVDRNADLWDASGPWRARAISGQLHSGELVEDPRTLDRTSL